MGRAAFGAVRKNDDKLYRTHIICKTCINENFIVLMMKIVCLCARVGVGVRYGTKFSTIHKHHIFLYVLRRCYCQ